MTYPFRTALLAGAALLPCLAARAADVTPEQGAAAEAAVRNWFGAMLGPSVKMPERPIQLTPAGDHFDAVLATPLVGAISGGDTPPAVTTTAQVRPLDNGTWSVDNIRTSTPIRFAVDLPVPDDKDKKAPPVTTRVNYLVDIKGQDGHGIIDPSLATPSSWSTSATSATIRAEGGPLASETQFGAYNGDMTVTPAGADRVDLAMNAAIQGYHMTAGAGAAVPVGVDMKVLRVALSVLGLNRAHAQELTRNSVTAISAIGQINPAGPPKIAPEVVRALLASLQDSASELSLDETVEGLAINAGGMPVTLGKAELGINGKSVDGQLEARMPIEVRDIGVTGALPPDMAALLPTVLTIRPVLSGVATADLWRVAAALTENRDPAPADINALFSHGGVKLGVEAMTLALAGATFEGTGNFTYTSPEVGSGTARITATGYDDMMGKVAAIPALSGQGIPVLAFVKGLGKTVEGKLVWDITYKDGKTLVNNVDLASLGIGAPKAAPEVQPNPGTAPHPAPAPRPRAPAGRTQPK